MADLFDRFESDVGYGQGGGSRQQQQPVGDGMNPFEDIDLTAIQSVSNDSVLMVPVASVCVPEAHERYTDAGVPHLQASGGSCSWYELWDHTSGGQQWLDHSDHGGEHHI